MRNWIKQGWFWKVEKEVEIIKENPTSIRGNCDPPPLLNKKQNIEEQQTKNSKHTLSFLIILYIISLVDPKKIC